MTRTERIKKIKKEKEPKRKLIRAIIEANNNGQSLKDISNNSDMSQKHLEDIMIGAVEPNIKEMVLLANSIGYNIELNLIPA